MRHLDESAPACLPIKRHFRAVVCVLIASLAAGTQVSAQPEPLHLNQDEAVQRALSRNFSIAIERFSPLIAAQELRGAWGEYDPAFTTRYTFTKDDNYQAQFPALEYRQDDFSSGIEGKVPWLGTQYAIALDAYDTRTNRNNFDDANAINSFAGLTLTQPLLRGFGGGSLAKVRIARRGAQSADEGFRQTVIDVVTNTVYAYNNYFFASRNLDVAQRSRDLAAQLLEDNRFRSDTGAIAPLDVVLAESELALREENVINARRQKRQAELALADLISDQAGTLIGPGIVVEAPKAGTEVSVDAGSDFPRALENRPDYRQAKLSLESKELELSRDRNGMLPQLDLVGSYGWRGQSDSFHGSFDDLGRNRTQAYSAGAVLSVPIPNRDRASRKAISYMRRNQADLQLKRLEQTVRLNLEDAALRLSTGWQRLQAAQKAVNLARQSLTAEEKKLRAGTSTTFVVLRVQQDVSSAEILQADAIADYAKAIAEYDRQLGLTLERRNITLE
ncbi:MAG: TolC family protein [Verrucomicrobiota bacterium]|nr:TolC family protein [Verrucomicrobiota bacterium]